MKTIYIQIIILFSLNILFAEIPINYSKFEIKNSFINSKSISNNNDYKYPGKAMLYSAIVPGLGQLYYGNWKRALFYSIIEASSWTAFYLNNEKSKTKKNEYMKFADSEWSFEDWMKHYYDWQNDEEHMILFSNTKEDTLYESIWDGSHHLEFTMSYNGNVILMSTTDSDENNSDYPIFRDYFVNNFGTWIPDTSAINNLINDPNFKEVKDSHYYENIFKYNHFYSGWSDAENISIYDNEGYLIAKSPKKWKYREMRDRVAQLQRVVSYATSVIMFNHVVSMIDAVWVTRQSNSDIGIKVDPTFDYNNSFGIGGISITFTW